MKHVTILVPGIMGSVLELNGEVIWPGNLKEYYMPYNKMRKLLSDELVATDCIRSFYFVEQYQKIIADLEWCGFKESDQTLIISAYDWRKDNFDAVEVLANNIDKTVAIHGSNTEISIIAHSMGGLIARSYLESNCYNGRPAFKNIKRLITLGTPHNGAAIALPLILGYEKRLFLNKDQVLLIASDPRYPSAYQLLPPCDEPFAWDGASGKQYQPLNIYNKKIAEKLGLSMVNLKAAEKFQSSLNYKNIPGGIRYFCFAGTRQKTTTHIIVKPKGGKHIEPFKIEQKDGGDGTVPTWSGFIQNSQRLFVGGDHATIYNNNLLRSYLATILGKEGYLRGIPAEVEVSIREKVVEPNEFVHLSVSLGAGKKSFSGMLTIEKAYFNKKKGVVDGFGKPSKIHKINYQGVEIEFLSLIFEAPKFRGVYRVSIRNDLKSEPSGYDELIVQQ